MFSKRLVPPLLIFLIGVGVFAFFRSFFATQLTPFSTEILAAVLGATLTVLITTMLLDRQSTTESLNQELESIAIAKFERMLELFRSFIQTYVKTAADEELSESELEKLEELALTIALLTEEQDDESEPSDNVGEDVCRFVLQLQLFGLAPEIEDERDLDLYRRHLARPDESVGIGPLALPSFVCILNGMRLALLVTTDEEGPMGPDCFAQRLLDYRGYRQAAFTAQRAA
jgi:hypothetical protein